MAFLTSIHCCPEAHWSVQTKQRENLWTAIPAINSSRRFNKICKWLFQEMVVESRLPIQIKWSWYHSFQKTMCYLMKWKYAIFEYQSNENWAFRFFWDTRYTCKLKKNNIKSWNQQNWNYLMKGFCFLWALQNEAPLYFTVISVTKLSNQPFLRCRDLAKGSKWQKWHFL